jgi:nitroreductase
MQTWEAITSRRNVRAYADRPIPTDDLTRVLEAGRRSPSSKNSQPWDFVVITDRDKLGELSRVWIHAGHVAGSAATIAFVAPVVTDGRQAEVIHYDLGQATMSMMLAATDLGIGAGHSAVGDQDLARRLLDLPADRQCAYLLALGYPADGPPRPLKRPSRRPFDEVVHYGRWGQGR